jgi:hypothetical protein
MYGMTNIKLKKLTLQYSYLLLEKDELSIMCEKVEKEIRSYMKEKYPEEYDIMQNTPAQIFKESAIDESKDSDEAEEAEIPKSKNKDLKKLYRKIIEKTHPDKTGNDKYASEFSRAAKAYSDGNLAEMLELSGHLNLDIIDLSENSIKLLKENVQTLVDDIVIIKKTWAWKWDNAKSEDVKLNIVKSILNQKGIKL